MPQVTQLVSGGTMTGILLALWPRSLCSGLLCNLDVKSGINKAGEMALLPGGRFWWLCN